MKRHSLILVGLIGAAVWGGADSAGPDNEQIAATLLDGSTYNVVDTASDKPVLLKFWATWCVACLQEMPAYIELHEKYRDKVRFVAVNAAIGDPRDRVASTVERFGLKMPVAYDESGDLWQRYDIVGTPAYVLLGSDGTILHRSNGHDDTLEPALDSALARKSPRTAVDVDGRLVTLDPVDGEVLVAYHVAIWCASYVEDSYPELAERCRTFDERIQRLRDAELSRARLVGFVSAFSTKEEDAARFRDKRHISEPVVFDADGAYAAVFGSRSFPHVTIVAPGGETLFAGNQVPENIREIILDGE